MDSLVLSSEEADGTNSYSYGILLVVFAALADDANNCVYIVVLVCNRHSVYFVGDS